MQRTALTVSLLLFMAVKSLAQGDNMEPELTKRYRQFQRDNAIKLLIGGHVQEAYGEQDRAYSRKYVEVGLVYSDITSGLCNPGVGLIHGPSIEIAPEKRIIAGFKYSAWYVVTFLIIGVDAAYYTDFREGNFKIRPSLGIGMAPVKLSVGYNIPTAYNKEFKELQKSNLQISLAILLKLKTIKKTSPDGGQRSPS